ncbi:MAG: glycyl-radical enzyme activating protein [Bacteroidales bacterium]
MACRWCHNPEGIRPEVESVIVTNKVGEMEFPKTATVGRFYSTNEIIHILEKERIFIDKSGGGVTFSGGEPLLQSDFLAETLEACQSAGFHTAVDTSGFAPRQVVARVLTHTNLVLFDIKHLDSDKHLEYTGVPNETILGNLDFILSEGKEVMIRIPVIPGYNDDEDHLSGLVSYLEARKDKNITMVSLLPYHKTGSSKYARFGMSNMMDGVQQPGSSRMAELKKYFVEAGIKVKTGG